MDLLDRLYKAGVLNRVDVEFARLLGRISKMEDEKVLLIPALSSRAPRVGEVCVDLNNINESIQMDLDETEVDISLPSKNEILKLIEGVEFISEYSDKSEPTPIIKEKERFYLYRYFKDEMSLAKIISKRIENKSRLIENVDLPSIKQLTQRDDINGLEGILNSSSLLLITGGPGTGKTTLASSIIECFIKSGIHADRIGVVAPTGRAAARMGEVISEKLKGVSADEIRPTTIHRRFGIHPDRPFYARYDTSNPVDLDLLVMDEASMVDLVTMTRVFEGLPNDCIVIMIGDPDQLASVQAGSVLTDLCRSSSVHNKAELRLKRRFRFNESIGRCADLINGDKESPDEFINFIKSSSNSIKYDDLSKPDWMDRAIEKAYSKYSTLKEYARDGKVEDAVRILSEFRFLSALRRGRYGCEAINERIKKRLDESKDRWFAGRVIMIINNDTNRNLFNGDLGVVVRVGEGLRVAFPDYSKKSGDETMGVDKGKSVRFFDPYNLPAFEDAFATTIHKAQGSEADEVVLLFPPDDSPILTREILYTGITRAKENLTIFAKPEIIRKCITTPIKRSSGLREKIDGLKIHSN
jgi:exodeoxyribonuclease V alpha subunit